MASAIRKEVTLRGYRPSEFTLFAFGGGGPTHVAGYMGEIPRAVMFPFSPVFCAYGSSIMDVVHLYERSQRMMLLAPLTGAPAVDREAFNAMVRRAAGRGQARGRGRGPELGRRARSASSSTCSTAARSTPSARPRRCCSSSPRTTCTAVYERFEQEFSEAFSPLAVNVAGRRLHRHVRAARRGPGAGARAAGARDSPARSRRPSARARRTSATGWTRRSTSSRRCGPGHALAGPAIVQAAYTTAVIPPGRRFSIESHGLGILEG